MFDSLLEWFNNALNFIIKWFSAVYKYAHSAWVWLSALILTALTIYTDTVTWITSRVVIMAKDVAKIPGMVETASNTATTINSGAWPTHALALANYISPVQETINCTAVLFALWIICTLVRIIKGWIPGEA